MLVNRTRTGELQVFRDLVFHGGEGATLELRVFCFDDLLARIAAAGFAPPLVHREGCGSCGSLPSEDWSLVFSLRNQSPV